MISKDDIEHLKGLARVEFGEKETEKLATDLGDILGYIDILKEADVLGVSESAYSTDLKNVFRKDEEAARLPAGEAGDVEANKYDTAGELIKSFPEKAGGEHGTYLKVKAIL